MYDLRELNYVQQCSLVLLILHLPIYIYIYIYIYTLKAATRCNEILIVSL